MQSDLLLSDLHSQHSPLNPVLSIRVPKPEWSSAYRVDADSTSFRPECQQRLFNSLGDSIGMF